MENFWTSNKTINGLRHFVLVNETKVQGKIVFLMVSVLDSEIYLKTTYEELINSGNWHKGWINLSKLQSITETIKKMIFPFSLVSFTKTKCLNPFMGLLEVQKFSITIFS